MVSKQDIAIVRDWLKKSKYLPQDIDDHNISNFIKMRKGSVQQAKKLIENFYMVRHMFEFYYRCDWDLFSPNMIDSTNRISVIKLPKKSPEGYTVIWTKILNDNANPNFAVNFGAIHQANHLTLLWDHELDDFDCCIVCDWQNIKLSDLRAITPPMINHMAQALQGATPYKIKKIVDINVPHILEWTINFITSLVSDKMKERRFIFSDYETLYKHFPKEMLPSDYGGDELSVAEIWENTTKQRFIKYRERIVAQKALVNAEKAHLPSHLSQNDYDTFRKLDID